MKFYRTEWSYDDAAPDAPPWEYHPNVQAALRQARELARREEDEVRVVEVEVPRRPPSRLALDLLNLRGTRDVRRIATYTGHDCGRCEPCRERCGTYMDKPCPNRTVKKETP